MSQDLQDYLFDLQGYLILQNALSEADLGAINSWIDAHWEYVENPWETDTPENRRIPRWLGNVETHTYNVENGVNFQNIIEGGDVFQKTHRSSGVDSSRPEIHPFRSQRALHPREFPERSRQRRVYPHPLRRTCSVELPHLPAGEHRRVDGGAD